MCRFSEIRGHPWAGLACSQHVGRGREDRALPWEEVTSLPRDPLWGPRVTWGPRVGTEEPSQGWAEGAPEPQARAGQSSRRGSSHGRRCRERGWGGGGCHMPRWALLRAWARPRRGEDVASRHGEVPCSVLDPVSL